ncbi:MAG TPA: thioesterase family protein [Anaerolineae bacterium]|nr:thioesterase family protein [Anaerolineae bacterium]
MSRKFKFFYPLKVRYAETDAQGHVFFGNYYTYFDESLLEYMRATGYTYQDLLSDGMDFLYLESHCHHYAPAYFDDVLNVHARIGSIGNSSLTFEFSIYKDGSDQLLATGHIIAVNVDGANRQPIPVPEALRKSVEEYEN